jgi:ubiquinone/menaquinone biosynthesis C-methylase UbiE
MKHIYENKDSSYYFQVREDLISLLPNNTNQKILEIGAGSGNTLVEIKERQLASEVVGVDVFALENSHQKNPLIDNFIIANLETEELNLPTEYFDVILAGDVLEHLVDPWKVVEKVTMFLKRGGVFIVSVPNIREISTISKILFRGSFNYDPEGGIMDKTHLRFFCKKNVQDLFNDNVYLIKSVQPILDVTTKSSSRKTFNKITMNIFEEFLTSQYIAVSQKK